MLRRRTLFSDAKLLPDGGRLISALISDGESWIITDFVPDATTRFTFSGYEEQQASGFESYFCVVGSTTFRCRWGGWGKGPYVGPTFVEGATVTYPTRLDFVIDIPAGIVMLNGVSCESLITVNWKTCLTLFAVLQASGVPTHASKDFKLYSSTVMKNGILVHEYLPALDGNGTPCVFDTVDQKYWYNNGTGTFTYEE